MHKCPHPYPIDSAFRKMGGVTLQISAEASLTVPRPISDGILVDPLRFDLDIPSLLSAGCGHSHDPTDAD